MTLSTEQQARLIELIDALCDGSITSAQSERLEAELLHNADAQWFYLQRMHLHASLRWTCAAKSELHTLQQLKKRGLAGREGPLEGRMRESAAPPIVLNTSSTPRSWTSGGFRVGGFAFSYAVSTLVMLLLIALAWVSKISYDYRAAWLAGSTKTERPVDASGAPDSSSLAVARVTAQLDCEWLDPRDALPPDARVFQGRTLSLASGLLELTYDSGAKVILEGPCDYEIDSPRGGYLSLGKLTAKIVARVQDTGFRRRGLQDSSPQPLAPSPLFAIHTPTATVTDLGTEFGVEVLKDRRNAVRVYQGRVAVTSKTIKMTASQGMVLHAGQSVSLDAGGAVTHVVADGSRGKPAAMNVAMTEFVRQMPKLPAPNAWIDLLDIVAGGDGLGRRRMSGIDPTTGEKTTTYDRKFRDGRRYQRVAWNPLVDGVFVPNSSSGAVQLDSAGHAFDGLSSSVGRCYGSIWTVAVTEPNRWARRAMERDKRLARTRDQLNMHADEGITFDLEAIRKAHPNLVRLLRFRAATGLNWNGGVIDFWVFVDGRPRWSSRWNTEWSEPGIVDVPLRRGDRFLTLVVCDSDGDISNDYGGFLGPVLDAVAKPEKKALKQEP